MYILTEFVTSSDDKTAKIVDFISGKNELIFKHRSDVHGDFGIGTDSTSHIEQLWAHLKNIIKNIYHTIPNENFVLFLRESEFRRNINLLSLNERWEEIFNALNYVKNLKITTFYSVEELLEITKKI